MDEARKIVRDIAKQEASKLRNLNPDLLDNQSESKILPLSSKSQLIQQTHAWLTSILAKTCDLRTMIKEAGPNVYRTLLMDSYFACQRHNKKSRNVNKAQFLGLFKRILERFFINEKQHNSNFDLIRILRNKPFIRSLAALSLEICMFSNDNTSVSFKDLLRISKVSALDFWKNLGNFGSLFTGIPHQLKLHLKEIESKIMFNLVWKENCLPVDLTFYNRLLTLVAYRTKVFCDVVGLSKMIAERVWDMLKFILPQKQLLFPTRPIEDLLVCSVFMVCRLNCEVPLSNLLRKYYEIFYPTSNFYLLNESPTLAELNEFFNTRFVLEVKDYLLRNHTPREVPIPELRSSESLENRTRGLKMQGKVGDVLDRTKQLWVLIR